MSVILTACKNSRQKAIEKALKKKAEKKQQKRDAAKSALNEKLGINELEDENRVKIWTFLMNGEPTSVVLHRDTLQVAWNGDIVDSTSDFCHCGSTIDFKLGHKRAQITSTMGSRPRDGMTYSLNVEGSIVPD
ncbi:uncharacterized protein LOC131946366 [Physella acuta]|uniref:uncharacterized protein LOC131946366 n=1 Tax=Physella acuta TaxID=109671 RepID=UPI0027DC08DB|nr:uncharacterized protein LOC131946366 [Physella acuta]